MYYGSDPETLDRRNDTVCSRFLRFTWKTITFFFSHITLVSMVVSYCILGAVTFEKLEKENEITVKKNISTIRHHIMDKLWNITYHGEEVLKEDTFINSSIDILNDFEQELIRAIKNHGWDGNEDLNKVQWNFAGSLFYSIIVITTIGYGHIAPKTQWGKVVTIVYAILGIPLMLLCLSNIGDIMATSFRFLYWKVCCYVCTKKPKKPKRTRSTRTIQRAPNRTWRSRTASFRRSARTSTRSQDSGFGRSEFASTSHSDTELRYHDEMPRLRSSPSDVYRHQQHQQQNQNRPNSSMGIERGGPSSSHRSRFAEATTTSAATANTMTGSRGGSLDRRKIQAASSRNLEAMVDSSNVEKTSVYCNRYAMEKMDHSVGNHVNQNKKFSRPKQFPSPTHGRRAISMPRTQYHLELPRDVSPTSPLYHDGGDTGGGEDSSVKSIATNNTLTTTRQKKKKPAYHPSPAIMSPLGYGHRSKYLDDPVSDDDYPTDNNDYYDAERVRTRPVPIWLCVFLVISYIIAGTFLFAHWESWSYLNSAYFCFITLTTIGFGDLFPSQRVEDLSGYKQNIAFCSLYLLFGIALLAMSFNLVQEEVIANVKKVAKTLGIIKPDDDDDDDDE